MKIIPLILLIALGLVFNGCGGTTTNTAKPAPLDQPNRSVNTNTANTNQAVNIPTATGPLVGRWKRSDVDDKTEEEYKPDGTEHYYHNGKESGNPGKYAYLSPTKVQMYDGKTGKPTRTFEFTVKDDKLVTTWDQGARPVEYTRVK